MRKSRLCPNCLKRGTYKDICKICKQKEKFQLNKKMNVKVNCRDCGNEFEVPLAYVNKRGGPKNRVCRDCRNKIAGSIFKNQSPEERKRYCRKGGLVKKPSANINQWKTIRSSPELWNKMVAQRSKTTKEIWDKRSEEEKNRIIKSWLGVKSRSKVSEKLKQLMIENEIYDGFVSEDVFHGFVPDEINHELKVIVELYGDLYHCNPRKYKDESLYVKAIRRTVGEQWKRDRIRLACFYKHGYTVIIVWEKDFYNNPVKQIERIKDEISKKRNLN